MGRYVDADVFEVFDYTSQDGTFDDGVQFVLEKIDEQPTADVVEVVRCKECKWYKSIFSWNCKEHKVCVREPSEPPKEPNDYCSYGERIEDGKNGEYDNISALWVLSADGFHCNKCNYKNQSTGFPAICPNCNSKMKGIDDGNNY